MIMANDELTCGKGREKIVGYTALYDSSGDSELSEGVILAAIIEGDVILFQIDSPVNILLEESINVLKGSLAVFEEDFVYPEIEYVPVSNCRFPTVKELDWYNELNMV